MLQYKIQLAGIISAIIFLFDLYAWQAFKGVIVDKTGGYKNAIKAIYFSVTFLMLCGVVFYLFVPSIQTSLAFKTYFIGAVFVLLITKIPICLVLFFEDISRLMKFGHRKFVHPDAPEKTIEEPVAPGEPEKISRSKFIAQTSVLVGTAPLIFVTRGIVKGAYNYQVKHISLPLPALPAAFDGLKVLHISDIHAGSFINKDAVKVGIDMINAQNADIVFFTGDLVNAVAKEMDPWAEVFAEIKAPMGVYSVLGNHDYGDYVLNWESEQAKQNNLQHLLDTQKSMGWELLRNEHRVFSRGEAKIGLIGVENWGHKARFQKYGDVDKALEGMEDVPVKILLSHDPSHWDAVVRANHPDIDLTLSGHTHGMQFGIENSFFKWSPVQYLYKQWAGLYQINNQYIYVNRGFGFLGFPGRVGILPEITLMTLKRA